MLDYRSTRRRRRRARAEHHRDGLTHHRRTDPATRARVRRPPPPPSRSPRLRRRPRPLARASRLSPRLPDGDAASRPLRRRQQRANQRVVRRRARRDVRSTLIEFRLGLVQLAPQRVASRVFASSARLARRNASSATFPIAAAADASVDSSSESTPASFTKCGHF